MNKEKNIELSVEKYCDNKHIFERFLNGVVDFFKLEPELNIYGAPTIHTIKSRLKDTEHLKEKIERKWNKGQEINPYNIFDEITDLAGVRVLHLYQDQFPLIHSSINKQLESGDWFLYEKPVAYSWDPEARGFFESVGLDVKIKDSFYTSIHYVVKPNKESNICCEIQVRTLFEEIWGEIDHTINYPKATTSLSCKEQLRVLSKLVSTGTRLADSIFRTQHYENTEDDEESIGSD